MGVRPLQGRGSFLDGNSFNDPYIKAFFVYSVMEYEE